MNTKAYALALLLAFLSPAADAAGPSEQRGRKPLSDAEKYSRPISEINPFGLDYGFSLNFSAIRAQGIPTPQLSMYHAQIVFAEGKCKTKAKPTRRQGGFRKVMLWGHDEDLDKPYKNAYAQAVEEILSNYQYAWGVMDESQRSKYCTEYWNDIQFRAEYALPLGPNPLRMAAPSLSKFYLGALSPISSESLEEIDRKVKAKEQRDKILGPILLLGQALSLAAGVSAANDSIAAGKSGNYSIAQMRYAQSRSLLRMSDGIGDGIVAMTHASPGVGSQAESSQQTPPASCQTLDHFDQYDADQDSDVWKKYYSLSSGCDALNNMRIK